MVVSSSLLIEYIISHNSAAELKDYGDCRLKKILVIDDDSDILDLLEKILLNEGYEVFSEGSAEGGLKSFELNSPDLIFTDIELPGISGLNFLEQLFSGAQADEFDFDVNIRFQAAQLDHLPGQVEDFYGLPHV